MKNMVDNVSALRALLRDKRLILGALLLADLERMRYEFQKIRAAWLKMCELYNAAANCVGVGAPYIGEGSITFEDNGGVVWDPYFGDVSIFFDPSNGLTNNPIRIGNNNPPIVISVYQENG